MEVQDRILFPATIVRADPYRGPLYRARPFIKWVVLVCWVLYFGVVVLILRGDTFLGGIGTCAVPSAVALAWLFATRTRSVWSTMDVELLFYRDGLEARCENYPITGRYDEPEFQQVRQSVKYGAITAVRYQVSTRRLEIYGSIHTVEVRKHGGVPESRPSFDKVQPKAVINFYLPAERAEEIIAAVCRNSGRTLDSVERYGMK